MSDKWQPIETAPKDGTQILAIGVYEVTGSVAYETGVVLWHNGAWYYTADGARSISYQDDLCTDYADMAICTHWMPLPKPPKSPNQ